MHLAHVVPLVNLPRSKDIFTYRVPSSMEALVAGCLVRIPFRKRTVHGVVWATEQRNGAERTLKDIQSTGPAMITPGQRHCIETIVNYYGGSRVFFVRPLILSQKTISLPKEHRNHRQPGATLHVEHASGAVEHIRRRLQSLNGTEQMLVVAPTIAHSTMLADILGATADAPIVIKFHSGLTQAEQRSILLQVSSTEKPIVVIATRQGLLLPWSSLKIIIMVDEDHPAHRNWNAEPRTDNQMLSQWLSDYWGCDLEFGSIFPTLPTVQRCDLRSRMCAISSAGAHRIEFGSDGWQPWIRSAIDSAIPTLVIGGFGRQLQDTLLCRSCEAVARCVQCRRPLVAGDDQQLWCQWCNHIQPLLQCPQCGETRLKRIPAPLRKIQKTIEATFPETSITVVQELPKVFLSGVLYLIAREHARALLDALRWGQDPPRALQLLIWNLALLGQTGYRYDEELHRALMLIVDVLERIGDSRAYIRAASEQHAAMLQSPLCQQLDAWQSEELALRKQFEYPPEGHLIILDTHARFAHNAIAEVQSLLDKLRERCPSIRSSEARSSLTRRKGFSSSTRIIVRIPPSFPEPYERLLSSFIPQLPAQWSITIDPDRL